MHRAAGRLHRRTTTAICFVALLLIVALLLVVTGSSYSEEAFDVPAATEVLSSGTAAVASTADPAGERRLEIEAPSKNPLGGCGQCHVDVVDELAVSLHQKKEIGCVKCHGPSKGHSADENNEVKPDRVIVRKQVDAFCGDCHKCSRPAEPPAADEEKRKVCIDCHGAHDLRPPKPVSK